MVNNSNSKKKKCNESELFFHPGFPVSLLGGNYCELFLVDI